MIGGSELNVRNGPFEAPAMSKREPRIPRSTDPTLSRGQAPMPVYRRGLTFPAKWILPVDSARPVDNHDHEPRPPLRLRGSSA